MTCKNCDCQKPKQDYEAKEGHPLRPDEPVNMIVEQGTKLDNLNTAVEELFRVIKELDNHVVSVLYGDSGEEKQSLKTTTCYFSGVVDIMNEGAQTIYEACANIQAIRTKVSTLV